MFGFGKTTKDPLADAKSAERWLASFPAGDPLAVHAELLSELARMSDRNARRTPAQLEAVFALDAGTAELRRTLAAQYIEHANRSSKIENQLWSSLFDLTQAFLLAYQAFGREVLVRAASDKWQQMLPELIARQVVHLGLDAKVRLYRYEQWIPAKWAELHTLFSLACSHQIERQLLALDSSSSTTTIEHEYLLVLVLQLMHAGNVTAKHLEYVAQQLPEWCQALRFSLEASSVTSFYVDLAARDGLKRRTPAPLEGRVLFLDTRPLHALLLQHIVVLEQKVKTQPLSERTAKRAEQLALLTKLASQVDPEFKPFARRGERTATAGTVDAIVGFGNIASYLRDEERNPVNKADSGKSFDGTMELAVFGRVRNEQDRIHEQARRRLATHAGSGGPWEVKDVSQTGFRLIAPMIVANAITLGTATALRPHGQSGWTLGVVRRIKRLTSDRAEIGLQVIASAMLGVDLIEQRKSLDADYSVDGEQTTINGRTFAGLFLALRKRNVDAPVHSLMLPAFEYQPSRRLKLQTLRSVTPVRLGRLLEQQPDWVWTAIEPLDASQPLPEVVPIKNASAESLLDEASAPHLFRRK
jgi:cyclic-di-GMP-binding protein